MFKVNIYLAQDTASTSKYKRSHGFVIDYKKKNGEDETRQGFGETEETYHGATLICLLDAMELLTQPCEITVHSEDRFVLNMMKNNLEKWAETDFRNAKGDPLKHAELWEELWKIIAEKGHELEIESGHHAYSEWLESEMKRREKNV